jgi:hypothetical protein
LQTMVLDQIIRGIRSMTTHGDSKKIWDQKQDDSVRHFKNILL